MPIYGRPDEPDPSRFQSDLMEFRKRVAETITYLRFKAWEFYPQFEEDARHPRYAEIFRKICEYHGVRPQEIEGWKRAYESLPPTHSK